MSLAQLAGHECIYLDWNATTPVYDEVQQVITQHLTCFGNPSSTHAHGRPAKVAVVKARQQVASLIGASSPDEICFCSCGTEADNWAIWGTVVAARKADSQAKADHAVGVQMPFDEDNLDIPPESWEHFLNSYPGFHDPPLANDQAFGAIAGPAAAAPPHIVTSCIEHPAVLEFLHQMESIGMLTWTAVPVNAQGIVSVSDVEAAIIPGRTVLITIMHSNNEIGTMQPVGEIAAVAKKHGVLMHSDAAQSIGKLDVNVDQLGVDMLTIVGHKFGAPKGIAALYIRDGVHLERFLCGGGQEGGKRAGTENVLHIAALGAAADVVFNDLASSTLHMESLRDRLRGLLIKGLDPGLIKINGPTDPALCLPNTLSISIKGVSASDVLGALSEQVAASAGAACHSSDGPLVSKVLQEIGLPVEWAMGTLRLSVGRYTTIEQIDRAAELLLAEIKKLLPGA